MPCIQRAGGRLVAALSLFLVAASLSACGPKKVATSYSDQARLEYEQGMEQFGDDNFLEAIKTFNQVRTRHPYSSFATLAELRIADSQYAMGKFVEAAAGYQAFVRFHPHHPERAYAMFRTGDCHYQQIPGNWWFMPPPFERELGSTRDALRELQGFSETYPDDARIAEAREMIGRLRRRLADHEIYVARFYANEEKPRATLQRTEFLLKTFPDVGLSAEALMLKAQAHLALEERPEATQALQRLLREYPASAEAPAGRRALVELGAEEAPAPEAPAVPVESGPGTSEAAPAASAVVPAAAPAAVPAAPATGAPPATPEVAPADPASAPAAPAAAPEG